MATGEKGYEGDAEQDGAKASANARAPVDYKLSRTRRARSPPREIQAVSLNARGPENA
ncbi:hypothetical protein [Aquisphaera insulae]|uniref:hypothetical protein n=1 Tax=Aquisphaera insulae TaxID=2712864 RepID=UPI0013EE115C|nr:hypothetical protein [Aquisphaera insulae]